MNLREIQNFLQFHLDLTVTVTKWAEVKQRFQTHLSCLHEFVTENTFATMIH